MSGYNFRKRNLGKVHKRNAAIFLDRDGTLIEDYGYLSDHNNVSLLPEVIPALKLLKNLGYRLILATNQSGIGRNLVTHEQLKKIHDRIAGIFALNDVNLDEIYFCPHHPDKKCSCRKPCPQMAYLAKRKFNLDLSKSFSVGDKIADVEFARNFGGKGILVMTGQGGRQSRVPKPDYVAKNIMDAARWIARQAAVIILLFLSSFSFAQEKNADFIWRKEQNRAFKMGETLKFSVGWGFITAGIGKFEVAGEEIKNGRKAYHIVAESYSLPFFDVFYKVRNKDESWMDTESLCSLEYQKHQNESNSQKEEVIVFGHPAGTFEQTEKLPGRDATVKKGAIPAYVQDIISAMFYLRTKNLKVGGEYFLNTHSGDRWYPLRIVVHGKEKVSVPAGKFNCLIVEPFVDESAGLFKAKGRLWIWMTDDQRKIPVMMKSKIFIGYITAVLTEVKN